MTLTSVVKYLDTTTKPGWVTWAVLNASPLLSLCQCTSLPHTTDGGLLRLSETPEKAELQWCVFETNALQDFALRNINHASSPRVTACELTLPNYTKGPRHQEACPFLGTFYSQECGTDVPFSEWSRFTCLNSQEQVQDLLCRQAHQWLTGQDVPKRGSRHQNLLGWTRAAGTASLHACDCGHPPTHLTEGHSLHILCVRKMCPFPQ